MPGGGVGNMGFKQSCSSILHSICLSMHDQSTNLFPDSHSRTRLWVDSGTFTWASLVTQKVKNLPAV